MSELSVIETMDPMVSIIVIANGKRADLERTLRSVAGQTFLATETMVRCSFEDINQSGEAATAAFGETRGSVFLSISDAGSKGWQVVSDSLDGTSAPLLAILLAGDVWHEDFLSQAVRQFRTSGTHQLAVAVGCACVNRGFIDTVAGDAASDKLPTPAMVRSGNFPLRSAVYRREAIERIGSCDLNLRLDDLRELNLRLLAQWEIAMFPQAPNLNGGGARQGLAAPQPLPQDPDVYFPNPNLFIRYSSDSRRAPGRGL